MPRRSEGDFQIAKFEALPLSEFLDMVKPKAVNQTTNMFRNDNGLITGNGAEGFAVEVIKVSMSHEHEVNRREVVNFDSRLADAFDDLEPLCPVRVDENAVLGGLNEKRGVADPSDAEFAFTEFGVDRLGFFSVTLGEHRGDDDLGKEVPLVPAAAEFHVHMQVRLLPCGDFFLDKLTDHVPWHCR